MDFKQLNEELWIIQDEQNINEMAKIEKFIIVHNDREPGQELDNLKFAHFHYNNVHFKFKQECPRNITELRQMIAFSSEQKKITDKELKDLLKLLQKRPTVKRRAPYNNVYDYVLDTWETLNEREPDYID